MNDDFTEVAGVGYRKEWVDIPFLERLAEWWSDVAPLQRFYMLLCAIVRFPRRRQQRWRKIQ